MENFTVTLKKNINNSGTNTYEFKFIDINEALDFFILKRSETYLGWTSLKLSLTLTNDKTRNVISKFKLNISND
jgi:hypothetical protein